MQQSILSAAQWAERSHREDDYLDNLRSAGVQQVHREGRLTSLTRPWPGDLIGVEGKYVDGDAVTGVENHAAIFYRSRVRRTVARADLVAAAREAGDSAPAVLAKRSSFLRNFLL